MTNVKIAYLSRKTQTMRGTVALVQQLGAHLTSGTNLPESEQLVDSSLTPLGETTSTTDANMLGTGTNLPEVAVAKGDNNYLVESTETEKPQHCTNQMHSNLIEGRLHQEHGDTALERVSEPLAAGECVLSYLESGNESVVSSNSSRDTCNKILPALAAGPQTDKQMSCIEIAEEVGLDRIWCLNCACNFDPVKDLEIQPFVLRSMASLTMLPGDLDCCYNCIDTAVLT
ncbi:hypothetical protein GLAREA_07563 [Glarea lozoyensis ATCC 20868]|uniref:Uncharacterized protein n=1 Tax=Glarea lozoyensis (strain ATCC 20868 / MF5171) TaxID=1116229 RepID=S3D3R4_GLAL2|nr:uncharacterized protein GLAREA_07563 [Glarea lozoyensis ATCC 20868]EPE32430.1 hypothetical protein GLAREA_07563 [Glarea lozoyensis ATCC 20868]